MQTQTDLTARLAACHDCGKPYQECGDVVMDNETWRKISPTGNEGGLLCANHTMARLGKAGLSRIVVTLVPPFSEDV